MRNLASWFFVFDEFKEIPLSLFIIDWFSCLNWTSPMLRIKQQSWIPPVDGQFKLNFDGASKGNPGKAGFGCVIRDHDHNVIQVACRPLRICNAIKTEAMSLLMGLREVMCLKLIGYKVEGDLAMVISWGLGVSVGS